MKTLLILYLLFLHCTLSFCQPYVQLNIVPSAPVSSDTSVVHFKFNNPVGSTTGSVITNFGTGGASMNGTITGAAAYITNGGAFDNCLYLTGSQSGTNGIVFVGNGCVNTSVTGTWTVCYWVNTTTAGSMIAYQGTNNWNFGDQSFNFGDCAGSNNGDPGVNSYGNGSAVPNYQIGFDTNWHFVALVNNSGTITIYVDNTARSLNCTYYNTYPLIANQLWIGSTPGGGVYANERIDEWYMYTNALTAVNVSNLYTLNHL